MSSTAAASQSTSNNPIVLIGNPNVGKSVLFALLTGRYATVSNYPGTTVEISSGQAHFGVASRPVLDAPGVNSLVPQSEDERVARDVLLAHPNRTVVQVADAKNLSRALFLTAQLAEMGVPCVLALNMWDEASERGISIDDAGLAQELGIPVVRMVATERRGLHALLDSIERAAVPRLSTTYPEPVEAAIGQIELALDELPELPIARRAAAVMILANDAAFAERIGQRRPEVMAQMEQARRSAAAQYAMPLSYLIARRRSSVVDEIAIQYSHREAGARRSRPLVEALARGLLFPLFAFFVGYKIADMLQAAPGWFLELPAWLRPLLVSAGGAASFVLLSLRLERMFDPEQSSWTFWRRSIVGPVLGFLAPAVLVRVLAGEHVGWLWPASAGVVGVFAYSLLARWREFQQRRRIMEALGWLCVRPASALPILLVALWALYAFVGVLGAGKVVGFVERKVFGSASAPSGGFDLAAGGRWSVHVPFDGVNYYLGSALGHVLPRRAVALDSPAAASAGRVSTALRYAGATLFELLFAETDGLIEVGIRYAIAIVLPIVGFFFLAFGLFEDSGYLPRLASMLDRVFKRIGLTGKAVLPMVLGLGCDTMATLTARILETPKQRFIVTLLLALAVPCSAQLGVIGGMLGKVGGGAFVLYAATILVQLFLVGALAARLIPGGTGDFMIELPPFRVPKLSNIVLKTLFRVWWFLKEAVPLFLIGTFLLFLMRKLGLLMLLEKGAAPVVHGLLGLPEATAKGFILGFLRRDYGAVLIFQQFNRGEATIRQALVAMVVITLFVPCVANFFVMVKEQGLKKALLIVGFIIPYAVLVGAALNAVLGLLGAFSGGMLGAS